MVVESPTQEQGIWLEKENVLVEADYWPLEEFKRNRIDKGRDCAVVLVANHCPANRSGDCRKLIALSGFTGAATETAATAVVDHYRDLEPREDPPYVWGTIEVFYKTGLGLTDRQIITVLPKLSAEQVEALARDLEILDSRVARTMLNAAIDAADPVSAAAEYLNQYHAVVSELQALDPAIARTLANAAFKTQDPARCGVEYAQRFRSILGQFRDNIAFARTVARTACRAADPLRAAEAFVSNYHQVIEELTATHAEPSIIHTLAEIAVLGADPLPTAHSLMANFREALAFVEKTHPSVARTIALSACRAADPLAAAQLYLEQYDDIVHLIGDTNPSLAHEVAGQAFRSDDPFSWARRYLAQTEGFTPKVETHEDRRAVYDHRGTVLPRCRRPAIPHARRPPPTHRRVTHFSSFNAGSGGDSARKPSSRRTISAFFSDPILTAI